MSNTPPASFGAGGVRFTVGLFGEVFVEVGGYFVYELIHKFLGGGDGQPSVDDHKKTIDPEKSNHQSERGMMPM